MNIDWVPAAPDSIRTATFFVHSVSPSAVYSGDISTAAEITRFVTSASQSNFEASVTLQWHDELYGANQPSPGQILEMRLSGQQLAVYIIASVVDFNLSSGSKQMTVVARSRDALPVWRNTRRVTDIYPVATPVSTICLSIAYMLGLTDPEVSIPEGIMYTVHSNTQLADITPWEMLITLLQSSGLEPYVDARGKLKTISRDTQRAPDIILTDNRRLISVSGSKSTSPVTEVRIKWLDPKLTEVAQQDQKLADATITAGFFQLEQNKDIQFSADGRQRAAETYLVIKQTANSGLLPVCDEEYAQLSPTTGLITLTTYAWVPILATAAMIAKFIAHNTPDEATVEFGPTVPIGRVYEYIADAVILLTMMSIGTGIYEVWGIPYDYVHARNTTVAYNSTATPWELNAMEIETDFVMDEAQAQDFAIRELLYSYRSASNYGIKIVDDPRVENGDIIALQDGTKLYVTGYKRDLSIGAEAVLDIRGFRV